MNIKKMVPGIIVCVIITLIAKILAIFVPQFGASSLAILLGILFGNTVFKSSKYNNGSRFCEKDLLSMSIVLMGATLNIYSISSIGINGVIFIVLQMTSTILICLYLGKVFKFNRKFTMLMAAGNAVCGSSAIAATSPAISADENDRGISITIVNLIGTILMFVLPAICTMLYSKDLLHSSAMMGGILQSVGQVLASAAFLGEDFVRLATIFKIMRIILIVLVVAFMSKLNEKYENKDLIETENVIEEIIEAEDLEEVKEIKTKRKSKVSVPWFIIGFFILSIINTLGIIPVSLSSVAKLISNNFEVIALAAIGMNVKISELIKQGPKALTFGITIGVFQIIFAVAFISILL
ncbi:YeiH family protein [Clostridium frigidicarnis]|uniref:Conserved hypothetical integral membrane protein n=1 Tax=Clostridium frigidicarnis TaxID=84698 RepID=A0A1I1AF39_9CLOT|nr:putative sulfate exporter family transporter [Clostridium frigidicarnis]SFB35108.1 conserved hypothetical integral membrane protein [Clostridium frigidicarnis]